MAGGCVDDVALDGGSVVTEAVPGAPRDPRRPFIQATCSGVNGGASLLGPAGCPASEAIAPVGSCK